MTYDTYSGYVPSEPEYNRTGKVSEFKINLKCGECIRSGYVYCTRGSKFGQLLRANEQEQFGYCCKDSDNCTAAYNSPYMTCSSNYTDPYLSY